MPAIKPDDGGEMDGIEEVACSHLIAGGNAAILLELIEGLFNQVVCPVQVLIVFAGLPATALGKNHDILARILQGINDPRLGIVRFVGANNYR